MKNLMILIFCLLLCNQTEVISQPCLPAGITFTTQEQIDNFQFNFPHCTEIWGDVIIDGYDIANLKGLNVLTAIRGDLHIGQFPFGGNPLLSTLTGLNNVTYIGGDLWIKNNDVLTSLTGLYNLKTVNGEIRIDFNKSLTNLLSFYNLNSIDGNIGILGNPSLVSLRGFDRLQSIGGHLEIFGNDDLIDFTGLENLKIIDGNLEIYGNNDLLTLKGLENLIAVNGDIIIGMYPYGGNQSLISLKALHNLDAGSIENLIICYNSSLYECEAQSICAYLISPKGIVEIHDNDFGCNSKEEIELACKPTTCLANGIAFTTQDEIDRFKENYPYCNEIMGDVTINSKEIENVQGLIGLTSIGGNLKIGSYPGGGNPLLKNLTGLNNVTSIGGNVEIINNKSLSILTGLYKLETIGGNLWIKNNPRLTSLLSFYNLTSIGGTFKISNNDLLKSLKGLDNLATVGGLNLYGNDKLKDLSGLEKLTSIEEHLQICGNEELISFTGLENLTSLEGDLIIGMYPFGGNSSLTDLTALYNIAPGTMENLTISYNSTLANCDAQSICEFLTSNTGVAEIHHNDMGCNSIEEVMAICLTSTDKPYSVESYIISPNPMESSAMIKYSLVQSSDVFIKVIDLSGKEIMTLVDEFQQQGLQKVAFNTSNLPAGIYFCIFKTIDGIQTKKIIKL